MAEVVSRAVGGAGLERTGLWGHGFVFAPHVSRQLGFQGMLKRILDIVVSALALVLLALPMLLIALLIKLDSRGPALIKQERMGRGLKPFQMYKFRSMVANAAELQKHLHAFNEATGPIFKMRRDPRLTRLGRVLRRTSFDEVPQLINVLRGEMSLVGPRPPFAGEVAQDRFRQSLRLRCAPGMTGLWQVSGRSDLSYESMVSLDLRYLEEWSIQNDLGILLQTPAAVLTGRGAR